MNEDNYAADRDDVDQDTRSAASVSNGDRDSVRTTSACGATENNYSEAEANAEYFKSLEKWVQDMYMFQSLNVICFNAFMYNNTPRANTETRLSRSNRRFVPERGVVMTEYRVAPVWKRITAELIDFIVLYIIKLTSAYILIDILQFADKWDSKHLSQVLIKTVQMDYAQFLKFSSDLMWIEIGHRIFVTIYETFWLWHGIAFYVAGSTPGKILMKIRVISCDQVMEVHREPHLTVLVEPGGKLPFGRALLRSVVKNVFLSIVLPLQFLYMFFQFNRTGYDILSRSIVVEFRQPVQRRL